VNDALVALAAREAAVPLLACDRRTMGTYAAVGVHARLV